MTVAITAALVLTLSACSSSSKNAGSSGSTNSANSASSTSGSSYRLMFLVDETGAGGAFLPYLQAFKAAVTAANARGGIKGHSIKLDVCDSQLNSNAAAACGQQAVSNHDFAVVDESEEDTMFPYLENAHIPIFNIGGNPVAWKSPVSFILNDLSLAAFVGFVGLLKQAGCTSFVTVTAQAGSTQPAVQNAQIQQLTAGAKQFGLVFKGDIFAPLTAPDMAPYATEAVSRGVDCVDAQATGAQEISLLKALVPVSSVKKIIFGISYLSAPGQPAAADPILNQLGSRVIILTATEGPDDTSNAAVKQWVSDQTKYGPKPADLESVSATNWADLQLAIKAAEAVYPDVTGPTVLNYLNHLHNYWPGVSPPVSFDTPVTNSFGPREFAAWVAPTKWTGGSIFPRIGPFLNLLTGASSNNTGS